MPDFKKVASASEVPAGEMTIVEVDGEEVAIANVGGEFFAFSNTCTHRGGPLGEGILTGDVVECPFHAGQFNVRTGAVVAPPPSEPVQTYAVRVDGDDISVALE
ncbi:MAG TPA: non-heme iron oxygenase ferredoxin subunit [Dehalococcoidia bacterium]|nr:non-heme iron oxygenase ferredoxin subunit [Dehalococcoidia bacterium]